MGGLTQFDLKIGLNFINFAMTPQLYIWSEVVSEVSNSK